MDQKHPKMFTAEVDQAHFLISDSRINIKTFLQNIKIIFQVFQAVKEYIQNRPKKTA